jgi:hypothetical protein
MLTRKRVAYLLCILLVTLSVLSCTIGNDDDDADDDSDDTMSSTVVRVEVVLPPELDAAQAATLLLEIWLHDLDDSAFESGTRDSDQVDTAVLLQGRIGVQEVVQGTIDDRLMLDIDFAGGVSAANNLVFAVLLFPAMDSAAPTFVARAGPVDLPAALGTTVAMTLGGTELVQFSDATASEGAASAVFAGTLAPSSPRAIALTFETQDGTSPDVDSAVAGEDYEATTDAVHFGAGATEEVIVIPVLDDAAPEPTETFNVLLELDISFPINNRAYLTGGANGGTFTQVVGTITDNDEATPPPATGIRLEAVLPPELDATQAANLLLEIWVHDLDDSAFDSGTRDSDQINTALLLQGRIGAQEVVQGTIDDRLILDIDFAGGVSAANNLVFAVLLFPAMDSAAPTFVARAGPVTLPAALGTTVAMTLGGTELVQFSNATASEGAASAVFAGTLAPSSPRAIALTFTTQDGTPSQGSPATAGEDYAATSNVASFASGETEETIVIPILDDAAPEPTETFNVLLDLDISFPTNNRAYIMGGLNGGTFTQVVGTITDNDP